MTYTHKEARGVWAYTEHSSWCVMTDADVEVTDAMREDPRNAGLLAAIERSKPKRKTKEVTDDA